MSEIKFQRRHYLALARALDLSKPDANGDRPYTAGRAWRATVEGIADMLALDNPRFDRERFILACLGKDAATFPIPDPYKGTP